MNKLSYLIFTVLFTGVMVAGVDAQSTRKIRRNYSKDTTHVALYPNPDPLTAFINPDFQLSDVVQAQDGKKKYKKLAKGMSRNEAVAFMGRKPVYEIEEVVKGHYDVKQIYDNNVVLTFEDDKLLNIDIAKNNNLSEL